MSIEDQDAVLGRTLREHQDLERHLSALHAEAGRISEKVIALGKALRNPSKVALEDEQVAEDFDSDVNPAHRISPAQLDEVKRIPILCRDIRETIERKREKAKVLESLGWKSRA